jgi:hypothetical protein
MANTIILKNSGTIDSVPTVNDLVHGELGVNWHDAKVYFKVNDGTGDRIDEVGASLPIANTIFIQVYPVGDDANNGRTWDTAVATFERALEIADERKTLDPYAITLIDVGAGRYLTEGHLDMPDDTIIRGVHRSVVVSPVPGYEETNQFRMGSGCFIEGIIFEGWRLDSLDNPTEGFAVSFRPGAVIRRVPYAHKIAVRTIPTWGTVPPPLDPLLANPFVPIGAGVALADGAIISPYSIFPNIMTWGATPVVANGIGYCAKNGGLINAVNAISLWAHKHFLALSGGQIILSACSTQFGDYTMWAEGKRNIIYPTSVTGVTLVEKPVAGTAITADTATIVDNMWIALSTTINPATGQVYTYGWLPIDEVYTRRDGANFIQCMVWVLESADQIPMENFAKGFYDTAGISVIDPSKLDAFLFAWENMRDQMIALPDVDTEAADIITALVVALNTTTLTPTKRPQPSTITAIGHTWSAVSAGVALTKIPPAFNRTTIEGSIMEREDGLVIASGQDDQGSALFVGGMKISADTGELSGPPFDQAVGRIATKSAIAFSNF